MQAGGNQGGVREVAMRFRLTNRRTQAGMALIEVSDLNFKRLLKFPLHQLGEKKL
jgi:hypothetical protein